MDTKPHHTQSVDRWIKRYAWAAVANFVLSILYVIVLAFENFWRLNSWEMWDAKTQVSALSGMLSYGLTVLVSGVFVLILFGLTGFLQYLLALQGQLLRKKEAANRRHA